jgi:hypothetical protein
VKIALSAPQQFCGSARGESHAAAPRPTLGRLWLTSLLTILALLALWLVSAPSALAAPPEDLQTSLVIGDGLNGPSGFEIAPDGRIFILERAGQDR